MNSDLSAQAHAFLFSEGGSLTLAKLAQLLNTREPELREALRALEKRLEGSGITVIQTDTETALVLSKDTSEAVRSAFKRDFDREIGDAGLEVLAIILYRGPSTRAEIDYIRGVNTSSTIRTLLSRGLIERAGNPDDGREYIYRSTVELLAHLGTRTVKELPEYETIASELAAFETSQQKSPENTYGTGAN